MQTIVESVLNDASARSGEDVELYLANASEAYSPWAD